jgi:hypothetical protein
MFISILFCRCGIGIGFDNIDNQLATSNLANFPTLQELADSHAWRSSIFSVFRLDVPLKTRLGRISPQPSSSDASNAPPNRFPTRRRSSAVVDSRKHLKGAGITPQMTKAIPIALCIHLHYSICFTVQSLAVRLASTSSGLWTYPLERSHS